MTTTVKEDSAENTFVSRRKKLFLIAYRMTGSICDSEDLVQDAWLRWQRTGASQARDADRYLTRIIVNLARDHLVSARRQRERYIGTWLPEPLLAEPSRAEEGLIEEEAIRFALLHICEALTPNERAVFVLRECLELDFRTIAALLALSPANCRKLAQRSRDKLRAHREIAPRDAPADLLLAFSEAARSGNPDALIRLLRDDAVLLSDGGGKALAALHPVRSPLPIARFFSATARALRPEDLHPILVNGAAGLLATPTNQPCTCLTATIDHPGRITTIYLLRNPDKIHIPGHGI
ncbi:MAG: sigma-70 family RNA polymerase sigma factor [Candidatus Dadabacteria bacterium]|nr:MAG: sigma-70 family RNA polymerase sigma factor [Candidatus Dadabacteria bacterium]